MWVENSAAITRRPKQVGTSTNMEDKAPLSNVIQSFHTNTPLKGPRYKFGSISSHTPSTLRRAFSGPFYLRSVFLFHPPNGIPLPSLAFVHTHTHSHIYFWNLNHLHRSRLIHSTSHILIDLFPASDFAPLRTRLYWSFCWQYMAPIGGVFYIDGRVGMGLINPARREDTSAEVDVMEPSGPG